MKQMLIMLFIVFTMNGYSQNIQQSVKLLKKNGKYKIEYKGKDYDANETVITVKPKAQLFSTPMSLNVIRKNKLGFMDIKVPKNKNIEEYANELNDSGLFKNIEYNSYGKYVSFNPNDPGISNQWNLTNINMYTAWDMIKGNPNVIVGIVDSGVEWDHEDIGVGNDSYQNIYLNPGEDVWSNVNDPTTGNGIDDDGNGLVDDWKGWNYSDNSNDVRTTFFHGTFVSGIVAAKTNNGTGIAGISGGNNSSGVKLLPYCVGVSAPDASVVDDAIIEAVDMGAKVISLSLEVAQTTAIDNAIQYAINNNVPVVCASGNESASSVSYPASNGNVIAVGATSSNNTRASFSNYGSQLDIVAPGVDIYSTTLNDSYTTSSGTSFSSPQVSSVIALLYSINPSLTAQEARNIIESTAQKVGGYTYSTISGHTNGTWNNEMGYGLLDAYAAVVKALGGPITGGNYVCSGGSQFSLPYASGDPIIWSQSSNIIRSSAQGANPCTFTSSNYGTGWIQATISTPYGNVNLPRKNVIVGAPLPLDIQLVDGTTGTPYYVFCTNQANGVQAKYMDASAQVDEFDWDVTNGIITYDNPYGDNSRVTLRPQNSSFNVKINAHNGCGWSGWTDMGVDTRYCGYYALALTPNPATTETTISIESDSGEGLIATDQTSWDLEVYNVGHQLKMKKVKIKGRSTTINTSGLKEGVYIVRVQYKDSLLTEKMIVKK